MALVSLCASGRDEKFSSSCYLSDIFPKAHSEQRSEDSKLTEFFIDGTPEAEVIAMVKQFCINRIADYTEDLRKIWQRPSGGGYWYVCKALVNNVVVFTIPETA